VDKKLEFDGKVFDMGFQYAVNTPEKGYAGDRSQREVADEEEPSHGRRRLPPHLYLKIMANDAAAKSPHHHRDSAWVRVCRQAGIPYYCIRNATRGSRVKA
jgi:hypothetical protein